MAIEFPCPGCQRVLRVPDEAAGKNAKCPQCGMVAPVPATQMPTGGVPAVPPVPAGGNPFGTPAVAPVDANPYAAPTTSTAFRPEFTGTGSPGGAIRPSRLDIGRVLNSAWFVFKRDLGICVLAGFIVGVVNFGMQMLGNIGQLVGGVAPNNRDLQIVVGVVIVILGLLGGILQLWLSLGLMKFYLKVVRSREKPEIADLFRGSGILSSIGATILLAMAMVALMAVCLLPALVTEYWLIVGVPTLIVGMVYLSLTLSQYMYLIVDRQLGAIDSLSTSATITQGNRLLIIVLGLVCGGIMLLGFLACFVGLLFASPFAGLIGAVAYLHMIGETTPE